MDAKLRGWMQIVGVIAGGLIVIALIAVTPVGRSAIIELKRENPELVGR